MEGGEERKKWLGGSVPALSVCLSVCLRHENELKLLSVCVTVYLCACVYVYVCVFVHPNLIMDALIDESTRMNLESLSQSVCLSLIVSVYKEGSREETRRAAGWAPGGPLLG
mmetsp:Transcript_13203/g.25998  ORF Transcript_13203/g.25998 Transcript_13203/m.25998 type:complete len:112 (+) Transcript_13203:685-1020(+)